MVVGEHYNRATRGYETRTISLSQRNKFVRRVFYQGRAGTLVADTTGVGGSSLNRVRTADDTF